MFEVEAISYLVNKMPTPSLREGSSWEVTVASAPNVKASLYYRRAFGDNVEVLDEHRVSGVSTDMYGVGYISILDIPRYFLSENRDTILDT